MPEDTPVENQGYSLSILDVLQSSARSDTAGLLLSAVYAEARDSELLQQLWEGDIRAFESIYARYADRLASCAAPYLRSSAVFSSMSQNCGFFGSIGPWLYVPNTFL